MKYFLLGVLKIIKLFLITIVSFPLLLIGLIQMIGGAKESKVMDLYEWITGDTA